MCVDMYRNVYTHVIVDMELQHRVIIVPNTMSCSGAEHARAEPSMPSGACRAEHVAERGMPSGACRAEHARAEHARAEHAKQSMAERSGACQARAEHAKWSM